MYAKKTTERYTVSNWYLGGRNMVSTLFLLICIFVIPIL